jgi:hypothetical protein
LYVVKKTGLKALKREFKKMFTLTLQFRDHKDISAPLVKLRAEAEMFCKHASC